MSSPRGCRIRHRRLLPLHDLPPPPDPSAFAPDLNLAPEAFLQGLTGHYLYAVLNDVLYSSLMVAATPICNSIFSAMLNGSGYNQAADVAREQVGAE